MPTIFKTFLVLTFGAFGAYAFSFSAKANFYKANSFAGNPAAFKNDADAKAAPKDLYIRNCARCHGADGAGQTEIGQKLDVPDLSIGGKRTSAAKIARVIANGKDEMPAFGKKLAKKQIASLAAYVRKL
jgi:mono/diheme cytochrome c family protein